MSDDPTFALLIGRWGGWPPHTALLIRTLQANAPAFHFFLLSEAPPPGVFLPQNVEFVKLPLQALAARMRWTVGLTAPLTTENARGRMSDGEPGRDAVFSSAKVSDLKPMWGEVFESLLKPFAWWGYLQEDVLLGGQIEKIWQ